MRAYYTNGPYPFMTAKFHILIIGLLLMGSCCATCQNNSNSVEDKEDPKHTNALINETSPYLLQHAHNPVDWMPWGDEAFDIAKEEDKLVLISIGYSSCHWCHVMEHESFEDESVAELMNEHFVCIKVDREERPDVDQVYMNAVQLMTNSGGWPLNCFTLPDGRPVFGGTYFTKSQWVDVLKKLTDTYENKRQQMLDYAQNLTNGVQQYELITVKEENQDFNAEKLNESVLAWRKQFDNYKGGPNRVPKFPLPNNYEFLMQYAHQFKDTAVMEHVDLTLEQMAYGGIYDQIGGGFARYSTDANWKVPHFEKMLYDNAQLVSLYSHAYQRTKNPLYKHVVYQTLEWVYREMSTKDGSFYSALDADSEGEEGKFYVWDKEELKSICGDDFELVKDYYNIDIPQQWEGNYILFRKKSDAEIAENHEMEVPALREKIDALNDKLLDARAERERPGLDDKSLTSWNCMMTIGFLDAYEAFGEPLFLEAALRNEKWLDKEQSQKGGQLNHTFKSGKSRIDGFLDDYAYAIAMYVKLYEVTFNEAYVKRANELTDYAIEHFQDPESGMFFFTSNSSTQLIARKMELTDNVIPASNSVMANNLWNLGTLLDDSEMKSNASQMLANVYSEMHTYGSGYSNWSILLLNMVEPYYEIAITGENWKQELKEFNTYYVPNKLLMGGEKGELPLLEGKFLGETTIFVCVDKSCKMPVNKATEAINQINQ